jgi:hypothetical protein
MTPHGFIEDEPKAIDKYKKEHSNEWSAILGTTGEIKIVEDNSEWEEDNKNIPVIGVEEN